MENRHSPARGHEEAVYEIRDLMGVLYRGFVAWSSVYADEAERSSEQGRRREQVAALLDGFTNRYLPRSVRLGKGTRKRVERFAERAGELYERFCAEVDELGYESVREGMAQRVSEELGPLKKKAESGLRTELVGDDRLLSPRRLLGLANRG